MPRYDYRTCKGCNGHAEVVGPLSYTRLCTKCAVERMTDNNEQISAGHGPYAERRLRRQLMAAQRRLIALERKAV